MSVEVVTKETIDKNLPFILKWSKNPKTNGGAINPGWKQQTEIDRFLELVENTPSILNDARFIQMESIEHDISYLRVKARLQSMKKLSGDNKGAPLQKEYTTDLDEVVPEFSRSKLEAEPFSIFTYTSKLFLKTNIEKESFLPHMEAILAERAGYSAENIGMYGIKNDNTTSTDGIHQINGVFKQLQDIASTYETNVAIDRKAPMGYFKDIDASKDLVKQIKRMITQFTKQRGKRSKAKIYVSTELEGLLIEEADQRPTERGDNLYFDDNGQLTLWGVPIAQADFLDEPDNGFDEQILMADPDSIVFGFLNEIESENDYELSAKAYLSTVDVYFDVLILYNKDVLAARIINIPSAVIDDEETEEENTSSQTSTQEDTSSQTSNEIETPTTRNINFVINDGTDAIQGATVTIGEITGTTGSQGGCTLQGVSDGENSVTVEAEGYTTKTETITVSESDTSFTISLVSA